MLHALCPISDLAHNPHKNSVGQLFFSPTLQKEKPRLSVACLKSHTANKQQGKCQGQICVLHVHVSVSNQWVQFMLGACCNLLGEWGRNKASEPLLCVLPFVAAIIVYRVILYIENSLNL